MAETLPLVDTAAGQAFKARQYDVALMEFQRLAAAKPEDPLVLRYVGMTFDRLGRYEEGIRTYRQALTVNPQDPALHFYLGTTYYKGGWTELAEEQFREVLRLAPESLYGERARQYLDALAQQRAALLPPGVPKPWGVYLQAGLQYDSNIPLAPSDPALYAGDRSGVRVFEYLWGTYRFLRKPDWLGAVEVSTYQAQYPEGTFHPFTLSLYTFGASLQRTTSAWTLPVIGSLKYEYRWVLQDRDTYSRSHLLTMGGQVGFTPGTMTQAYYRYTRDNFADEGFDPAISSRDADNHALGLAQGWYLADRKGQVRVGYEFLKNRADGLNFRYTGHKIGVDGSLPVGWGVQAYAGGFYTRESYPDFQGAHRRKTDRRVFTVGLTKWLNRHVAANVHYLLTDEGSNYDLLAYRRWIAGGSVAYVY